MRSHLDDKPVKRDNDQYSAASSVHGELLATSWIERYIGVRKSSFKVLMDCHVGRGVVHSLACEKASAMEK